MNGDLYKYNYTLHMQKKMSDRLNGLNIKSVDESSSKFKN